MQSSTLPVPLRSFEIEARRAVYRAIFTRRDVRSQFLPRAVDDAALARLLLAAHHAPSVGFMQPWSFLVIRDPNVRGNVKSLFESANAEASRLFEDERRASYMRMKLEGITDAPVNLCITCDRNRAGKLVLGRTHVPETDIYSTVCAVQNIWLAARSEGIGVGWVSIYRETELKELLGIPADQMVIAYLCIGHVAELFATPELAANGWRQRLELAKLIHFDTWRGSGGSLSLEPAIETERQEFVRTGCFEP